MKSFKYGCVVDGAWYCGRRTLEGELARFLEDGQNVVLMGERRMGKTSLVFGTIRGMRGWRQIYIDLMNIRSVEDFCKRILSAVKEFHQSASLFEKALKLLPKLRPVVTHDPVTGGFGYSFDVRGEMDPQAIEDVVSMLSVQARKKKVAIVFDEFQDVLKLPDSAAVLAVLRSKIQFQSDIPYVFTGSIRHQMIDIFDNPDSPFYKSAVTLGVGRIDRSDFVSFLKSRFAASRRRTGAGLLEAVLDEVDDIPGDAQELCEALCDVTEEKRIVVKEDIAKALKIVYAREGDKFESFIARLSPIQMKFLVAMSRRGGKNVQSGEFLAEAGISNAASVRRALARLEELRLIYCYRGEWRFNSTFFASWLRRFA